MTNRRIPGLFELYPDAGCLYLRVRRTPPRWLVVHWWTKGDLA